MLKTMKQFMCRALALVMVLSSVSVPMVSNVSAEGETNVIWQQHYYQDFDKLTSLTDSDEVTYTDAAVELKNDSAGGKYIELTPANVTENQSDGIGTDGKWAMFLNVFEDADKAESVKLEYRMKFTEIPEAADVSKWTSYSGMHAKAYATGRAWAARVSAAKSALQNTTNTTLAANENWYTITEEVTKSNDTYTWVTELSQNGSIIDSVSKSCSGMFIGYLMGCDATGSGIYVDNIKVSYGYNKPEDLTLNFEGLDADSAFTHDKVYMQNTTATVINNETDGGFLRLTCTDSASTTKNSVQINAFENFSLAKTVTVEYKARNAECSCDGSESAVTGSNDVSTKHPGLNTKFKGFAANGTTTANTWAAKTCHYKVQSNDSATRDSASVGTDWYTVKHIIDNTLTTNNLTTSITDAQGVSYTNTKTYVPVTLSYYELVVTDVSIVNYLDIDEFKVTYSFDEEAASPTASVKVYADDDVQTDLANASMLTDKVQVSFSEVMNKDTVTENSVYIQNASGSKVVCGAELDSTGKVYTMTIPSLLEAGTYKVVVTAGAMSAAGAAATPAEVEFTVSSDAPGLPEATYTQDYLLDFNDQAEGAASDISGVIQYNSGVSATIVSGGVTGNCLSVVPKNAESVADPIGSASKWSAFFNKIDTTTNADRVKISYDVKLLDTETQSSTTYGGMYAADKEYSVLTGATRAWANRIGTSKVDLMEDKVNIGSAIENLSDWITVTYVYDKASKTLTGSYSQNGTTINSGVRDMSKRGMPGAFLLGANGSGEEIYIDNIGVSYIYNAPTVTADSVTLTNVKGETQANWNDADLITKNIKIDFGAVMDTATLNNSNIYLSKDGGTTKVAYVPEFENGVYTMTLTETLAKETKYTLYISDNVANVKGVAVGEEGISFDITTGKGQRRAELMAVKVNDEKITSVSGFSGASKAKVEVDYSNTTGEAQNINLIIAFYTGDTLEHVELVDSQIDDAVVTMTYNYEFDLLADMSDVTAVKVMSWSAFGEMIPLSDSIDL